MGRLILLKRLPRSAAFFGLLFFCILTLWAPGLWPVALFLFGTFALGVVELVAETRPHLAVFLLLTLPLWGLFQVWFHWTVYTEPTWVKLLATLSYACVVFLVSGIPERGVDRARLAMLWFSFAVAVAAILQSVSGGGKVFWIFEPADPRGFLMGPIIYHNHWAAFIEIALPLAVYYTLRSQSAALWLYSTMAAALYASVVISASRSGVIICTLELVAVPLLVARRHRMAAGVSRALAPLAGVLLLCTLIVGPEVVWNRLQEDPTLGRADWDRSSVAMFRDQKWHGFGLGNWPVAFPHYATFDAGVYVNQAHSDWLQWAVEGGVFYVGVFLALAWIAGRRGWRFPWAAGVPAVFCQALVDYPFSRPALAAWTFTMFGLALRGKGEGD